MALRNYNTGVTGYGNGTQFTTGSGTYDIASLLNDAEYNKLKNMLNQASKSTSSAKYYKTDIENAINSLSSKYGLNYGDLYNLEGIKRLESGFTDYTNNYQPEVVINNNPTTPAAPEQAQTEQAQPSNQASINELDRTVTINGKTYKFDDIYNSDLWKRYGEINDNYSEGDMKTEAMSKLNQDLLSAYGIDANTLSKYYTTNETAKSAEEAAQEQATATDTSAQEATNEAQNAASKTATSAINAGIGKSAAGMLGDSAAEGTTAGTNQSNIANAYKSNAASNQSDYLARMGQVQGMEQQANQLNQGTGWAALSGGLSGAASGASTGFALSDERCKEAPSDGIDDNKLIEALQQFIDLSQKLKALKGE